MRPNHPERFLCVVFFCCAAAAPFGAEARGSDGEACSGTVRVKVPPGLDAAQRDGYGEPVWQQAGRRGRAVGLASGEELVEVVMCRDEWCQVRWRGRNGWLPKGRLDRGAAAGCRATPAAGTASKPAMKKPLAATPWAAWERRLVRANAAGEVECLARDGLDCDYDRAPDDPQLASAHTPTLACGEDYRKKHGYTGYDTPGHWCWRYRNALEGIGDGQLVGAATGLPVQLANADGQPLTAVDFRVGWAVDQVSWNGASVGGNGGSPRTASLVDVDSITVVYGKYQYSGSPVSIGSLVIRYRNGTEDRVGGAQGFSDVRQDVVRIDGAPVARLIAWSDGYLVTGLQFVLQGRE